LSPEEVVHFLNCVERGKRRVILTTCYAAGLRISEAVHLKATAIDSARMVIAPPPSLRADTPARFWHCGSVTAFNRFITDFNVRAFTLGDGFSV
jgi:integrase